MTRVLIIDDSPSVRRAVTQALDAALGINVVGAASSAEEAQKLVLELRPDVLTVDMAMPGMNGIEFLTWLMARRRMPAIVLSAVTPADSKLALKALDAGACEVISKPGLNRPPALVMEDLIRAIRQAARTKLLAPAKQEVRAPAAPAAPPSSMLERPLQRRLIAIGASTGGTKAIEVVLRDLPVWSPGIAIVQHMPAGFTGPFAARLNTVCELAVREATDGERLTTGTALIAPGGMHLSVEHRGGAYFARVHDGDRVHHQKPAVDVLFKSVAACAGADAVGVLLTGMGADGAEGMRAMKASGAHTIAEDESTCVVFGMPAAAIKLGAAIEVEPLPDIGRAVVGAMAGRAGAAAAIK